MHACVCVFGFVHVSVVSMKAKVARCPGAGISNCKLPDVCAGNQTWVPYRNNRDILTPEQSLHPLTAMLSLT